MELQGICHKMHAALKTHSVTDQSTSKANVEYKFILDRSETLRSNGRVISFVPLVAQKHRSLIHRVIVLNVLKPRPNVICAL